MPTIGLKIETQMLIEKNDGRPFALYHEKSVYKGKLTIWHPSMDKNR